MSKPSPEVSTDDSARPGTGGGGGGTTSHRLRFNPTSNEQLERLRQESRAILQQDEDTIDAVDAICEANGWTREDFISSRHTFTYMELFLLQFPTIPQIRHFPNLVHVKLMHIALKEIDAADFALLPHLEVLWLSENDLTTVRNGGLKCCPRLRELYVQNNNFTSLDPFLNMPELEVLFASRNRIAHIDGLSTLPKLRSLWLAHNGIATIRGRFDGCCALEELNLAGNRISSFREIPCLNALPLLTKLFFADPQYGECPVALMSNYQTFTMYHVPRITYLDYIFISPQQRVVAETTYAKKRVFYSMRLHNIGRVLEFLEAEAQRLIGDAVAEAEGSCIRLGAARMEWSAHAGQRPEEAGAAVEAIDRALGAHRRDMRDLRGECTAVVGDMREASRTMVSRLLMELSTGGNVRLEEGRPKDLWFQSCSELVRNRFFPSDYDHLGRGISEVKVARVTRLHNRALRSAFDRELGRLVDVADATYKRALEYLFLALPVQGHESVADPVEELNGIIENGFRAAVGSLGHVPLTNSVYLADQVRMMEGSKGADRHRLTSKIIVAKVFLGRCAAERGGAPEPAANVPLVKAGKPIDRRDYPKDVLSVYRTRPDDTRQRIWHCFDDALVLPEYIVDLTYASAAPDARVGAVGEWPAARSEEMAEALIQWFPQASASELTDAKPMAPHLLTFRKWLAHCGLGGARLAADAAALGSPPTDASQLTDEVHAVEQLTACPTRLVLSHRRLSVPLSFAPSTSMLERLAGVHEAYFHDNALRMAGQDDWSILARSLPHLHTLVLAGNRIEGIVTSGGPVLPFPTLATLDLSRNAVADFGRLTAVREMFPALQALDLSGNPLLTAQDGAWAPAVVFLCAPETLTTLNGAPLADVCGREEMRRLAEAPMSLQVPLAAAIARSASGIAQGPGGHLPLTCDKGALDVLEMRDVHDAALRIVASTGIVRYRHYLGDGGRASPPSKRRLTFSSQALPPSAFVETAPTADDMDVLRECHYFSFNRGLLVGLPAAVLAATPNLVHLQLEGHFIKTIAPDAIRGLTFLETCSLRRNLIATVPADSFSALSGLRRLDLGHNRLTSLGDLISPAAESSSLQCLTVDNNQLTTLDGLHVLEVLQELYAGHNKVPNEKSLNALRDLQRLIILDLSGNPCAGGEMYRRHAIFHFKRLKVLDGVAIDVAEAALARDTFAGRVSAELLNERVAPASSWAVVTELNLSSCALREVLLLEAFTSLQHLRLEHNAIASLDGVAPCTKLVTLNVADNKIGLAADNSVGRALEHLVLLESLSLEANQIQSLGALGLRFPKLRFLNVKGNELTRLDGLTHLSSLRELILDRNKLRSLDREALLPVAGLRVLHCDENAIKVVEAIQVLRYLTTATFASNRVADIQDVFRAFEGMPLVTVSLLGNPVVRKPMYRPGLIHAMQCLATLDQRPVTLEERERVEMSYQTESMPNIVLSEVRMPMGGGPIMVSAPTVGDAKPPSTSPAGYARGPAQPLSVGGRAVQIPRTQSAENKQPARQPSMRTISQRRR